jgi:hypothetical protein
MWDLFRLIFGLIIDVFGHEQRWKPKSWCSNSSSSCCDGASQFGCYFLAGDRVVLGWACHLFPKARGALATSFDQIPWFGGIVQVSDCFGRLGRPAVPRDPTINPCPRLHIRVGVRGCL